MRETVIVRILVPALCMGLALAGCGSKNSDGQSGGSKGSECAYTCTGTGFAFDLPESIKITNGYLFIKDMGDVDYDSGVMMGWPVYYDVTEEEYNKLTEETVKQAHVGFSFQIVCVKDVNSEEEAKAKIMATAEKTNGELTDDHREQIASYKTIHQEDGYIWLKGMVDRAGDIREECKEEYNRLYDGSDEIISGMKYFHPEVWKGGEEGAVVSFETIDIDGNPISSEALFAKNKVTMINIWATTCGPCIEEMPELEEMNKEFQAKGGAVVGLVDDVWVSNTKYMDEAKSIIKDTGVTYTNLCAWDGYDELLSSVGTPTTYFVDSKGKLIGDPILGASPEKYREKMEEYLSKAE